MTATRVSRIVCAIAAVALVGGLLSSSASALPVCAPQLDGQWAGNFSQSNGDFGTWGGGLVFIESALNGSLSITSTNGFPTSSEPTPIIGSVACNHVEFQVPVSGAWFSGDLASDGRSASGYYLFGTIVGQWDLTLSALDPPAVSVGSASIQEGNNGKRSVEVPVSLSRPSTAVVKVNYSTNGLTALPNDYVGKPGTVTFTPGANGLTPTTKWIKIAITPDVSLEPDEAFGITLSSPVGATINNASGVVYIQDDDSVSGPVLTISGTRIYEGDQGKRDLRLTVWLSQPASAPVDVDFGTGDGSAVAPFDYRPKSDDLTLNPGQVRKTVTIPVVPDNLAETYEEFYGYLLGAVGAPIDRDMATFTIMDE